MRTFTVVIYEAEPDEGGFWAEVPELPGCVAQGETIAEVQRNAIDAVEAWIEASRDTNEPLEERHVSAVVRVAVDEGGLVPA